jgi:hypothetical protein
MADSQSITLGIDTLATAKLQFLALAPLATTPESGAALLLAADIAESLSRLRFEVSEVIIKTAVANFGVVDAVRELHRALKEVAKIEPSPILRASGDLLVTFTREGETELMQIVPDGDRALKSAMIMLAQQDALRAGDMIAVGWHRRPNVIEQGLA